MTLDRNKPVQTRDGRPVRIITWTEGSETYPIVGFVGADKAPDVWTAEGKFVDGQTYEHIYDLVNVPPKQTVTWHWCRPEGGGHIGGNFDSSDAVRAAVFPNELAGLLKITWEDRKPISVELVEV